MLCFLSNQHFSISTFDPLLSFSLKQFSQGGFAKMLPMHLVKVTLAIVIAHQKGIYCQKMFKQRDKKITLYYWNVAMKTD